MRIGLVGPGLPYTTEGFNWTKITEHTLVKGWAAPDDPALTDYWAVRRPRGPSGQAAAMFAGLGVVDQVIGVLLDRGLSPPQARRDLQPRRLMVTG